MTETKDHQENALSTIIIIVVSKNRKVLSDDLNNMQYEAIGLAEAIGLSVVSIEKTIVPHIKPGTLFGSGKTDEYKGIIENKKIEIAFVDHALSPIQQRNLELHWRCKVVDRTALILEIFGARARTHEGRLQVELAAIQYQRSRLVRSWTHLERQRGGYGFVGGPGESQLEIDRRLIDKRIIKLQLELKNIRKMRGLQRSARQKNALPTVALVGYTNAGNSSLYNKLTAADVPVKDMLFATLDPTMRGMCLPSGKEIILCDTVGFISELPTELIASFRATLEEIIEADLILHVQDVSAPDMIHQRKTVKAIIEDITEDKPVKIFDILNKIDHLNNEVKETYSKTRGEPAVLISATSGIGIDSLLKLLDQELLDARSVVTYDIPFGNGAAMAWLYKNGNILTNRSYSLSNIVKVALLKPDIGRFEHKFGLSTIS